MLYLIDCNANGVEITGNLPDFLFQARIAAISIRTILALDSLNNCAYRVPEGIYTNGVVVAKNFFESAEVERWIQYIVDYIHFHHKTPDMFCYGTYERVNPDVVLDMAIANDPSGFIKSDFLGEE